MKNFFAKNTNAGNQSDTSSNDLLNTELQDLSLNQNLVSKFVI